MQKNLNLELVCENTSRSPDYAIKEGRPSFLIKTSDSQRTIAIYHIYPENVALDYRMEEDYGLDERKKTLERKLCFEYLSLTGEPEQIELVEAKILEELKKRKSLSKRNLSRPLFVNKSCLNLNNQFSLQGKEVKMKSRPKGARQGPPTKNERLLKIKYLL